MIATAQLDEIRAVDTEKWLPIAEFDGRYEVSNRGQVRSVSRIIGYIDGRSTLHAGRVIRAGFDHKSGYSSVTLWRNNRPIRQVKVHILVAEAFVPNPAGLPEVNHADLDKSNNRADNLEWISKARNVQHANERGRGNVSLAVSDVRDIRFLAASGAAQCELAKRFGVSKSQICAIVHLRAWRQIR